VVLVTSGRAAGHGVGGTLLVERSITAGRGPRIRSLEEALRCAATFLASLAALTLGRKPEITHEAIGRNR
jgi:hypothetical protein